MSFSYSNGVITQTGTDTDPLSISGLTGVTITGTNDYRVIQLDGVKLVINGTLSISKYYRLYFINTSTVDFTINGTVNVDYFTTNSAGTIYHTTPWAEFGRQSTSSSGQECLQVSSTGTLNWRGGSILADPVIKLNSGSTVLFNNSVIDSTNNNMLRIFTSNLTFEGPLANIRKRTTINASGITLDNYSPKGGGGLDHGSVNTDFVLYNYNPDSNVRDSILRFSNGDTIFNASTGMNLQVRALKPTSINSQNGGGCRLYRKVSTNIKDISNNPLQDVKTFLPSYNDGNRVDLTSNFGSGWDFTAITNTTLTTASNGKSATHNQILKVWYLITTNGNDSEVIRFDKDSDDGAIFTAYSYKYGFLLQSNNYNLNGLNDLEISETLLPDADITESNKAVVDAYTEIDTSSKFYERAASHLEDNLGTYLDFIVTRSGNQIVLTNKTLVIDATYSSVFAYSDPQITIKASTYTGGATATTGSVTTLNGALLSGGTFDCDVNYQSGAGTTITNVTVNGVIDFNTAGTYTIDSCTITEVTNSSGGSIILNLTNGSTVTTNTGPNITIQQLVDITAYNIIDGSRVQIYNVTKSVEIDNSVVSGGSGYSISVNLLGSSVDDGDTIRLRATYTSGATAKVEALSTGVIGTNGLSFLTTQDNDDAYNTLALDGYTITKFTADYVNDEVDISIASDFTLSELYAWWVYNLTTSQGISEFFAGITAVDEANFKINNNVVNIYLDNATSTNIIQTDNRRIYREDGNRPVVSSTSGGGGIDVEWRSPVTIAASEYIQSNLTSILDDTDELQQNQGDWLTATGFSTFDPSSDQVIVTKNNDKTNYSLTNADKDELATRDNQNTINENVKKSSKLMRARGNLPDS